MRIQISLTIISNIFMISFIAVHVSPNFSVDAIDEFKACDVSYNCGELVDVTYPFWGNERKGFCGRKEFQLTCNNNKTTTIEINSLEYYVLNISQSNQRMRIARSDLFDDYCPKYQTITPTLRNSQFVYSSTNLVLSVWYNCPELPGFLDDFMFWCDSEGETDRRRNYALEPEAMNLSIYLASCGRNMKMEVTIKGLEEGKKNRTMLMEKAVKEGFEVEYGDLYTVACDGCKDNGGTCGGNSTHGFYCFCGSGDVQPYVCRPVPISKSGKLNVSKKVLAKVAIASGSIILILHHHSHLLQQETYLKQRRSRRNYQEIFNTNTQEIQFGQGGFSTVYQEITHSFENKLGQGGFSTVYEGKLSNGCNVAVKLLNDPREKGQYFINEVVSITKTSHINLVTLLGFCYEQNKRASIYEYMPKGSLDKYISHKVLKNGVELDRNTLYRIAIGVARGLEYLHRGCNTRILHFDIKPHNILLDNEFCPKISDFGLSKQCKAKESHVSMTGAKGTAGFMAPEIVFRNFGKISHKSDVYSYGMLVLEMVGERKNPNDGVEQRSEEYFPDWIYSHLTPSEIDEGCWWGNTEEEEEMARKMIIVGLHCIQTLPDDRPSMTDVVAMLEGSVDGLKIPPKPNLFGPPSIEQPQPSSSSSSN